MVGLDFHPILDLHDRHGRGSLQQFHHDALVGRVEVLDNDKPETTLGRNMTEKLLQGFQAAGRRAPRPTIGNGRTDRSSVSAK